MEACQPQETLQQWRNVAKVIQKGGCTMRTHTAAVEGIPVRSSQAALGEALRYCRAELSNDLLDEECTLIDRLIGFAFDTLGVRTLDVRVTTAMHSQLIITVQDAPLSSLL
jgi:hypothetical protein